MDLVFDGKSGVLPAPDTVEFAVLQACADRRAWPYMKRLERGDFERAIDRLRDLGWGFQWVSLQ